VGTELKNKLESKRISRKKAEKLISKLQKSALKRPKVSESLQWLIQTAVYRVNNKWTPNRERLAWSRVLVQACSSATILLRDAELEELEERIKKLEEYPLHSNYSFQKNNVIEEASSPS